ncbi:hypothetical protein ABC977_05360 [Thioalkalicoccus limnaeus]|uniref:Uncharacterized protein n=1 Tax=Thioalkalicoccus limnaeus TaxID=120681 RepID=A0ABV4BBS3_9GAMM
MGAFEEDLYDDFTAEEAEGAALIGDELDGLGMDGFEGDFEDDFADSFGEDSYEDESYFDIEAMDDFETDDSLDFEAYEDDYADADEALENVMAYALGAEDADEFLGRLARGLVSVGRRAVRGIRRAAPTIGRIAGGVSRVASLIPHPAAQAVGRVAGLVGRGANLVQQLRAEGATEEEALDAFAEMAARDPRAMPIVAGLTARTVLKSQSARLSPSARKQVVRQMAGATRTLTNNRGPAAVRAMPKIARSVTRTAAARATPPATAVKAVRRTTAKVARSPALTRKLARPSPTARQRVAVATRSSTSTRPRSFTIQGPARITITAA